MSANSNLILKKVERGGRVIDLILTEEQKMFRETLRKFGETEVHPVIQELEAKGELRIRLKKEE